MYVNYIILLSSTYCIQTVNSINNKQIEDLWNALRTGDSSYVTFRDLYTLYPNDDKVEFEAVIQEYGTEFKNSKGEDDKGMNFEQFKKAALKGLIPRFSKVEVYNLMKAIKKGDDNILLTIGPLKDVEDSIYVTVSEMALYYKNLNALKLKHIMENYANVQVILDY